MKKIPARLMGLVLALGLWSCTDSQGDFTKPGDQLQAGANALDEKLMSALLSGDTLTVRFGLAERSDGEIAGRATLKLRDLSGATSVESVTDFILGEDDEIIEASVAGVPAIENAGAEARYVLDYSLKLPGGTIHGSRSLFMLLPKADLVVLLPTELVQDASSVARVFLVDPRSGGPIKGKSVSLELTSASGDVRKVSVVTDETGMALLELKPEEQGTLSVTAHAELDGSSESVEAQVQVVRDSKVLLTTDKPIYQPGQVMFLRTLALDAYDHHALADRDILYEINDSKGNKVFKLQGKTNEFGVASAVFQLGNQVLLGTYTIKASLGDVVTEKTVTVDKYVLPRFKVNAQLDKTWYMAGQNVHGEVQADYFFGKPVAGGTVKLTVFKYEAEWVADAEIIGQTNSEGLYVFDYKLPDYVVGQPLEGGKALLMLELVVTDTADHEEKIARNLLVTDSAMDIVVIPESGDVVPNVENDFFVFVTDPTGQPTEASCTFTVNGAVLAGESQEVLVPPNGPARVALMPHSGVLNVKVDAVDAAGTLASASFDFSVGSQEAAVLLRTDKSVYKVGDSMAVSAYISGGFSHVYLDVVRKNQTVLTKTLVAEEGVAEAVLDLDNSLAEDLVLNVYMLADNGQFIRDSRVVYVQPASDLDVAVTTDKPEYRPGDKATVSFEVKNAENNPVQAALGVQVVDEAVFALSENKPGLLKLYFLLEDELANPTYQIGKGLGWSFGSIFEQTSAAPAGSQEEEAAQDTAEAAFAALGSVPFGQKEISSWDDALAAMKTELAPVVTSLQTDLARRTELVLASENVDWDKACTYLSDYFSAPRFYDPWGNAWTFAMSGDEWWCSLGFKSAGPDEISGSKDDVELKFDLWSVSGEKWRGGGGGWPMAEEGDFAGGGGGPPDNGGLDPGVDDHETDQTSGGGSEAAGVKVRSWFPETLFVAPSIITDEQGRATVEIPMADSITEWRMSTLASSQAGDLGSRTDGITVFQDFFVDVDFPRFLTRNDEVQFPVVVYNYLPEAQSVDIQLEDGDWFEFLGDSGLTVDLEPGDVRAFYFPVKVTTVGWHALTVYGIGPQMSDAVQRTVEVRPDGKEVVGTWSARFANDGQSISDDTVMQPVDFPDNAVPGSQGVVVQIMPGLSSHIVGGMDSMLALPGG